MRIVLIGGSGFIGSNLTKRLSKLFNHLMIYDKNKPDLLSDRVQYCYGNLNEPEKLTNIIKENDIVVHLVSTSVPNSSNKNIYFDAKSNILDTLQLFEICIQKNVKKIIYPSSGGSIYGIPEYIPIDENHITNPTSAYGIHKLSIEKYLMLIAKLHKIQTICLRISNPYGPGQRPYTGQGVVATFLASAIQEKQIEIWGDGSSVRDYLYIDDLVEAFIKAIEYDGKETIFNIGSGTGSSISHIIETIELITNKKLNVKYIEESKVEVKQNILNCKKAADLLGWNAAITLSQGIDQMSKTWDEKSKLFTVNKSIMD